MKSLALAGIMFSALCAFSLTQEDRDRVDACFAPTNSPVQVDELLYPIFTNCWFNLDKVDHARSREIQYYALTNLCQFKVDDTLYWIRWGFGRRRCLFYQAYSYSPTTNDLEYIYTCADHLGRAMQPVAFDRELRSGGYAWYNSEVVRSKALMTEELADLVSRYEKILPECEWPSFRTNIIERARLTEDERRIIWPDAL